jgi:transglutaminase-like putative cysteine protease
MRYQLSHRTSYAYASSVDAAHHIAHLRAREFPGQRVSGTTIVTNPQPTLAAHHRDYFGNLIDIYRIDEPHQRFDIEVRAEVDVKFPEPTAAARAIAWEEMRAQLAGDGFPKALEAAEFTLDSPLVPFDEALAAYGAQSFTAGRSLFDAARELTTRIKADFQYQPGATDISTPLHQVFEGKSGVCQDFAHLMIAACRAHGVAAGYVSGYIRTAHSREEIALRGADASHAWVAVWCGEEAGWVHLDPTNDLVAHEDHVVVAWGRDFSDVSPLRGVILGGDSHSYGVQVTLVPTEPPQ